MRRKILAGGMTLVMVGVLLGACGVPQEDLDAAEAALVAAEAETVALQDDIDAAELATRLATDSIATLEADLAAAEVTLAELQAVEDAIVAAAAAAALAGTYTNEEYNFTVTYSPDFEVMEVTGEPDEDTGSITLHQAEGLWADPGVYVSVNDYVEGESYVSTVGAFPDPEASDYVIVSNTQVETSDGSTGSLVQYTWMWDIYPLSTAVLAVVVDGKVITVSVTSSGSLDLAGVAEMATALTFTGGSAGTGTAPDDEGEGVTVVEEEEVVEDEVVEEEVAGEAAYGYEHPAELSFAGSAVEEISEDWSASFQHDGTFSGDLSGIAYTGSWGYGLTFTTYLAADFDTFEAALLADSLLDGIEILNLYETALADGTPASLAEFTAITDTFPFHVFSIGVVHGDYWVVIHVRNWTDSGEAYDEAYMAEIVHTLTLTGAAEEEVAAELSYTAIEYVDADYSFTFSYPDTWTRPGTMGDDAVLSVGTEPYGSSGLSITVADVVEGESLTDMINAGYADPDSAGYGDSAVIGDEVAMTTPDGSAAVIVTGTHTWSDDWGDYPGRWARILVEKDGKTIYVSVSTGDAEGFADTLAEEIARTLTFTGAAAGGGAEVVAADCPPTDLSYTATEYANADLGFTVQYDGSFWTAITETETYWNAIDTTMYGITGLYVAWDGDVVEGEGYADFYAGVAAEGSDTDYVLVSETEVTTCDGTAATRIQATINWGGTFDGGITSYAVAIGGKWTVVSVVGGPGWAYMDDQTVVDEVLATWTFE